MADKTMSSGASTGRPGAQGLFTRQSSGLVRELGIPAATGIALASVAVVNTFINFYGGLLNFSQVDMVLPLLLGAAIWFVAMFAYRYLLQAIPRAGGEYIYLSRIIHPAIGTMVGIACAVGFSYTLAANANFAANYVPLALNSLGLAFNSSALTSAAGNISSTTQCIQVTCARPRHFRRCVSRDRWTRLNLLAAPDRAGHPGPGHLPGPRLRDPGLPVR